MSRLLKYYVLVSLFFGIFSTYSSEQSPQTIKINGDSMRFDTQTNAVTVSSGTGGRASVFIPLQEGSFLMEADTITASYQKNKTTEPQLLPALRDVTARHHIKITYTTGKDTKILTADTCHSEGSVLICEATTPNYVTISSAMGEITGDQGLFDFSKNTFEMKASATHNVTAVIPMRNS